MRLILNDRGYWETETHRTKLNWIVKVTFVFAYVILKLLGDLN